MTSFQMGLSSCLTGEEVVMTSSWVIHCFGGQVGGRVFYKFASLSQVCLILYLMVNVYDVGFEYGNLPLRLL